MLIGIRNYTQRFPKCFKSLHTLLGLSFCVPKYQFTCCQCTKLIHFQCSSHCGGSHCESGRVKCCLYTPRRLQWTAGSCKQSNCNKTKTNRESRSSEVLSQNGKQRVSPLYHVALHASLCIDFLWIIIHSTKNHSIATNSKKNSMIGANIDTSRITLAWIVVLQILGVNGVIWTTLGWSQNDFPMVQCSQTLMREISQFCLYRKYSIPSCNGRNPCP